MAEVSVMHCFDGFLGEVIQPPLLNHDVRANLWPVARELAARESPVEQRRQGNAIHRLIRLSIIPHGTKLARRELLPPEKWRVVPLAAFKPKLETILVGVPTADARIIHPFLRLLRQFPLRMAV